MPRRQTSRTAAAAAAPGADPAAADAPPTPPPPPPQAPTQAPPPQPKPKLFYATYNAALSGKLTTFGFRRNLERDFELGDTLGVGGFGTVRVAVERSTRRRYAAKLLPKRFLGGGGGGGRSALEPLYAARVLHEVDALAAVGNSLNASHLVAAYEDERGVALVMELCSGGSLLSRVQPGAWGEREAARAMRDVVRALAHCHSAGVVVRDVKPDNFLYRDPSPRSPLKMIDFGLATTLPRPAAAAAPVSPAAAAAKTDAASAAASAAAPPPPPPAPKLTDRAGTPHFCAPEVLRMSYSFPADVWSAGVIAYLLLAGRFPWALDPQAREDEREAAEEAAAAAADGRGRRGRGGGAPASSAFGAQGPMAAGGMLANRDLFRAILRGELDFDAPPFGTPAVSEAARDCVRSMLRRDPDARPTAVELLRHPWLARAGEDEEDGEDEGRGGGERGGQPAPAPPPLEASLVQRLQRYGAYGRVRQLALRRVAHLALLEYEEEEEREDGAGGGGGGQGGAGAGAGGRAGGGVLGRVIKAFAALPRGADGRVPYDAVADALARYDLSDTERRMLVLQLDADRDGRVDLDEFAAATADWGALQGGEGEGEGTSGGGTSDGTSDGSGSDGVGGGGRSGGQEAWGRWLRTVFDALDQDHSGRISGEELEDALCRVDFASDDDGDEEEEDEAGGAGAGGGGGGGKSKGKKRRIGAAGGDVAETGVEAARLCDPGAVAAALREADADGDGALSLSEFEALLQGGGGGALLGGDGSELLELFPSRLRRRGSGSDSDGVLPTPSKAGED